MNLMNEGVLPPNELDDRDERREESEAQDIKTTEDVIAWLRKPREGENAYLTLWRDEIADRLEEAHRRERGDAAKLREALKRIVAASIVAKNANAPEWILQRMADIFAMATIALSASPRNCDIGTPKEQAERFDAFCQSNMQFYKDMFGHDDEGRLDGWDCREDCPVGRMIDSGTAVADRCQLAWAQTPYEEGGGR